MSHLTLDGLRVVARMKGARVRRSIKSRNRPPVYKVYFPERMQFDWNGAHWTYRHSIKAYSLAEVDKILTGIPDA